MATDNSILKLQDISKSYPSPDGGNLSVLESVNLSVQSGETIGITGPSGSGKSTLLNIMGTLDTATSGNILLQGQDISSLDEKKPGPCPQQRDRFRVSISPPSAAMYRA